MLTQTADSSRHETFSQEMIHSPLDFSLLSWSEVTVHSLQLYMYVYGLFVAQEGYEICV